MGNDERDQEFADLRCPKCGHSDVRRSSPTGLLDAIMAMFARSPWRCRSCRYRFHLPDSIRIHRS